MGKAIKKYSSLRKNNTLTLRIVSQNAYRFYSINFKEELIVMISVL
jgi:hypothetical protein